MSKTHDESTSGGLSYTSRSRTALVFVLSKEEDIKVFKDSARKQIRSLLKDSPSYILSVPISSHRAPEFRRFHRELVSHAVEKVSDHLKSKAASHENGMTGLAGEFMGLHDVEKLPSVVYDVHTKIREVNIEDETIETITYSLGATSQNKNPYLVMEYRIIGQVTTRIQPSRGTQHMSFKLCDQTQ